MYMYVYGLNGVSFVLNSFNPDIYIYLVLLFLHHN